MSRILYKYLDVTDAKYMIGDTKPPTRPNLQFTNASQLNDPFDCHPNLLDYSDVPDIEKHGCIPKEWIEQKEKNDALNLRNDTWLCSLSKVHDNLLMWTHYCQNHTGVCIGLNMEKVMDSVPPMFGSLFEKPSVIEVQYQDILQRPKGFSRSLNTWLYMWSTKAKDWEYEQEVRLVMKNPSPQYAVLTPKQVEKSKNNEVMPWTEMHHYMPINGECFESIYFGVNIDLKEKEKIINFVRKHLSSDAKLYQMQIDENAFRLKAELITD